MGGIFCTIPQKIIFLQLDNWGWYTCEIPSCIQLFIGFGRLPCTFIMCLQRSEENFEGQTFTLGIDYYEAAFKMCFLNLEKQGTR